MLRAAMGMGCLPGPRRGENVLPNDTCRCDRASQAKASRGSVLQIQDCQRVLAADKDTLARFLRFPLAVARHKRQKHVPRYGILPAGSGCRRMPLW
jgi:hypothetical protein